MRKFLTGITLALFLTSSPVLAASGVVNLAAPAGNVGMGTDGTNLLNMGIVCGAAASTIYGTCINQLIINSSGQALVSSKTGSYASGGSTSGQYGVSINTVTTLTVPSGSIAAEMCVEAAQARYTDDGVTPTSTVGIPVVAGQCFAYAGPLAAFQIIGSGATLDVSYYK